MNTLTITDNNTTVEHNLSELDEAVRRFDVHLGRFTELCEMSLSEGDTSSVALQLGGRWCLDDIGESQCQYPTEAPASAAGEMERAAEKMRSAFNDLVRRWRCLANVTSHGALDLPDHLMERVYSIRMDVHGCARIVRLLASSQHSVSHVLGDLAQTPLELVQDIQ